MEYYSRNKKKENIRSITSNKISIPKNQECQMCNKEVATMKHHEDYLKPLEVIFVCSLCHGKTRRWIK